VKRLLKDGALFFHLYTCHDDQYESHVGNEYFRLRLESVDQDEVDYEKVDMNRSVITSGSRMAVVSLVN
jgi:hypothetical protein